MERVLEDVSFSAPDHAGRTVKVDAAYVHERLDPLAKNTDLSKFIL
jgi:ATP-dependent HslUV protease ATP-binding subunit HslU